MEAVHEKNLSKHIYSYVSFYGGEKCTSLVYRLSTQDENQSREAIVIVAYHQETLSSLADD